ncbi:MAG: retroviral-like aspartic protease family protein [Defluviitaleaceae bacterium]|nr:retroviral-like aspartic protease family protein [Defluviitaleaceae bacterium]
MKAIPLERSGVAYIYIALAHTNGKTMPKFPFLVDTGATRTTIPKETLIKELGYTEDFINTNKLILSEKEKPIMANGERADVYKLPGMRLNIGGYEIQHDFILSSDTINLSLLLGLDVLNYFKFTFDFDSTDSACPYGKMFYALREKMKKSYSNLQKPFAHKLTD